MTTRDGFTPLLDAWLAEEGRPTTPDYLDDVFARTAKTRQRPAWLSPGRWLPMSTTTLNTRLYPLRPVAKYIALAALLIAAVVAATLLLAGAHRVPPPFGPAANGRIYFDVNGAIVSTKSDGSDRRSLDIHLPGVATPIASPDGTTLAFISIDPSTVNASSMWAVDTDGSHLRKLTGDVAMTIDPMFTPAWSPDGKQLAFGAFQEGENRLFIANADGSGVRRLGDRQPLGTNPVPIAESLQAPVHLWTNPKWSLSGRWIAFADEDPNVDVGLAVIHPDGTGYHRLPVPPNAGQGLRGFQVWAPDGSDRLLHADGATPDFQGASLAVVDVDTGIQTTLAAAVPGVEQHRPAWSPDATRIAFHRGSEIVVVNADGTGPKVLHDTLGLGTFGWSPDGTRLFGLSPDNAALVSIAVDGASPPIRIPLEGTEAGIFSWQRVAP